jgi:hypothetical protein
VLSAIRDLLTDPGVIGSVLAAIAVVAATTVGWIRALPWWLPWATPLVAAVLAAWLDVGHYFQLPDSFRSWSGPLVAAAVAALALALRSLPAGRPAELALTHYAAAAATGVFLCVPETMLLRLLPGPLVVLAVAATAGWVKPLRPTGALALALLLGWVTVRDGQARGASIVGGAACLAAVWLVPLVVRADRPAGRGDRDRLRRAACPAAMILAVLACSRLTVAFDSTASALVAVTIELALVAGLLWRAAPAPAAERPTVSSGLD